MNTRRAVIHAVVEEGRCRNTTADKMTRVWTLACTPLAGQLANTGHWPGSLQDTRSKTVIQCIYICQCIKPFKSIDFHYIFDHQKLFEAALGELSDKIIMFPCVLNFNSIWIF